MELKRWAGIAAVVVTAALAGGCAVYSTPGGEVVGPAPVVVSPPPVVVTPFFWGHRHYHHRPAPRYYSHRYPSPRYYGRPYYRY
jgi:hypothetical protein